MTSTVDHLKSLPLPLGGGGGSLSYNDDASSESLGSSIPEELNITVILPNGTEKTTTVNSGKQMLDLAVQLSASNRLSPADHTLVIFNPETGRPLEYKASQKIGALGIDTVHLVNKKASKDKSKRPTAKVTQPFEMTNRLTVNLPKNQKTVVRISPQATLAEIFQMVCKEKGLDPYKHELRHPTQPNQALNMASPLSTYNTVEISVVNVADSSHVSGQGQSPTKNIYDTHWTYTNNSMPRQKSQDPPAPSGGSEQHHTSYMPEMTEKKKRKSFLGLFSRKKGGKFNVSETTYSAPVTSIPPPNYDPPVLSNGSKPQAEVRPQPQAEVRPQPQQEVRTAPKQQDITPQTSTSSLKVAIPQKAPRKKRQAPAPPGSVADTKPLVVNTETTTTMHSRASSHSSGFDETNMLESPGASSGQSSSNLGSSVPGKSSTGGSVGNGQVVMGVSTEVSSGNASTVSRQSSMSTGKESSTSSLQRGRKKRKAPPPPGGIGGPSSTSSPSHSASPGSSTHTSPTHVITPPGEQRDDDAFDTKELQMAIAEELKKDDPVSSTVAPPGDQTMSSKPAMISRPCQFIPPPPPDSPPPSPDTDNDLSYTPGSEVTVADSSTQVHASLRHSLCSEVSSCDSDMTDVIGEFPNEDPTDDAEISNERVKPDLLERQKSDIAVFVEQMEELTENVRNEEPESEPSTPRRANDSGSDHASTDVETGITVENKVITETIDTVTVGNTVTTETIDTVNTVTTVEVSTEETEQVDLVEEIMREIKNPQMVVKTETDHNETETGQLNLPTADVSFNQHEVSVDKGRGSGISDTSSDIGSEVMNLADELTDSEDETQNNSVLPDSNDGVVLLQKKVVPAFTLEFTEDDILEPVIDDEQDQNMDFHFEDGDLQTQGSTKLETRNSVDVSEALSAFDDIMEEDIDVNTGDVIDTVMSPDTDPRAIKPPVSASEQQMAHQMAHVTKIQVGSDDFDFEAPDSGRKSPQDLQTEQGVDSFACDEEITFDNLDDVMYVAPHDETPEDYQDYQHEARFGLSDQNQVINSVHEVEVTPVSHQNEAPEPEVSPPAGFSLYSLVSGVKSSRTDAKQTSPPEPNPPQYLEEMPVNPPDPVPPRYLEDIPANYTSPPEPIPPQYPEDIPARHTSPPELTPQYLEDQVEVLEEPEFTRNFTPEPETIEEKQSDEEPVFRSLRDAYRNQQKEPDVIIIPKPQPYQLPPVEVREQKAYEAELKAKSRYSAVKKARNPSGEKSKSADDVHTVAYKTESLAVSRKAQNIPEHEEPRFWGPRPWSARGASEPLPAETHNALVQNKQEAIWEDEEIHLQNQNYSPPRVERSASSGHGISHNSPKDHHANLSFSPRSEEEEHTHHMEEKSITMIAHPVERKSILKTKDSSDGRQYNSSLSLVGPGSEPVTLEGDLDPRQYSSSMGLSELGQDENRNLATKPLKPIIKRSGSSKGGDNEADTKEKAKKSLQEQYVELQHQFTRWQQQLIDNQTLLSDNKLVSDEETHRLEEMGRYVEAPDQPLYSAPTSFIADQTRMRKHHNDPDRAVKHLSLDAVEQKRAHEASLDHHGYMDTYDSSLHVGPTIDQNHLQKHLSLDAVEQKKAHDLASENYMRLSTPRPFSHQIVEPRPFVPRPIIKKRFSMNERYMPSTESNNPPREPQQQSATMEYNNNHLAINGMSDHLRRSSSVDSTQDVPESPEPVTHKTLTASKSDPHSYVPPPPLSAPPAALPSREVRERFRAEPVLDPREELMIAIRSAGGRGSLKKV